MRGGGAVEEEKKEKEGEGEKREGRVRGLKIQ